jgi:hypothetical protein
MNLYRVIVLREDKENLERGVWADNIEFKGESLLFSAFDTDLMKDRLVGLYPARYTIITSMETKEEFDKRKGTI